MKLLKQTRDELSCKKYPVYNDCSTASFISIEKRKVFNKGFDAAADLVFDRIIEALNRFDLEYSLETHPIKAEAKEFANWLIENKERFLK